jgi:hypothetical protein
MELLRGVSAANILCWRSFHFYLRSFLMVDHDRRRRQQRRPDAENRSHASSPSNAMNSRRFTARCLPVLPTERIADRDQRRR